MKKEVAKNFIKNDFEEDTLSVEELKSLIGRNDLTDQEAKDILMSLKVLVDIIIDFQFEQEKKTAEDKEEDQNNLEQAA